MTRTGRTAPTAAASPLCPCHGEPMTWNADRRRSGGGWWRCRAKRREYNQRRSAQRVQWIVDKRDTDPIYRISEMLRKRRYHAMKARAARHLPREERG